MELTTITVKPIISFYDKFNNREIPALEQIIKLCLKIRSNSQGFKNLYSEEEAAKSRANNTKELYDKIISLIPNVEIKDYMLLENILNIMCVDNAPVYSDQLYKIICANGNPPGRKFKILL